MDFLLLQTNLDAVLRRLNREAYNDGISGYRDEFELISITSDEIQLNCKGLIREGVLTPNIIIRNNSNPNFPLSIQLRDEDNRLDELACYEISGPFKTFQEGLLQAGYWIISNVL